MKTNYFNQTVEDVKTLAYVKRNVIAYLQMRIKKDGPISSLEIVEFAPDKLSLKINHEDIR